jgi:hypothetical protein
MSILMSSWLRSWGHRLYRLYGDAVENLLRNFTFVTFNRIFRFHPEAFVNAYPDGSVENAGNKP